MHPDEDILVAVASGTADVPRRAVVEGHLASCAECRRQVGALAEPGGHLLESLAGEAPQPALWESIQKRVAVLPQPATPSPLAELPLAPEVRRELPGLSQVAWHWLGWGTRYATLAADLHRGSALFVVRSEPGRWLPEHVHQADEELLVLAGGFTDTTGRHEAGDFARYPAGSIHHPLADPDGECWCLVRLEKPNLFLGWRGVVQRLVDRRTAPWRQVLGS
jgi:putative transcriptional regulator